MNASVITISVACLELPMTNPFHWTGFLCVRLSREIRSQKKGALRRLKIGNGIRSIPGSNLPLKICVGNSPKMAKTANVTDFICAERSF